MISKILILVLAVALVVACAKLMMNKGGSANTEDAVLENILARTSVRSYTDKAVEDEKIEKMLRAGMAAPSAVNVQPWHFVVVTDKAILESIAEQCHNAHMAKDAPLAIVVCGDTLKAENEKIREFWVQDVSAATENVLLEAQALGLGAVWTGVYPVKERCAIFAELLGLPENIVPLSAIIIGYPDKENKPKDKWKEENVSYNKYSGAAEEEEE